MVVLYTSNYETPLKQYLTDLDKEMSEILQLNIPDDESCITTCWLNIENIMM